MLWIVFVLIAEPAGEHSTPQAQQCWVSHIPGAEKGGMHVGQKNRGALEKGT